MTMLRMAMTSINSIRLNPECTMRSRFLRRGILLFMSSGPLSNHGTHGYRGRIHGGIAGAGGVFHLGGHDHQLGVGRRLSDGPANVVNHLAAAGAAIREVHLIPSHS